MKDFIKKYKSVLIYSFLFFILAYSIKIFTYSYGIDTEMYIINKKAMLDSWLIINRFSLVFLKYLLSWLPFSIFWTNLFTVIFFYLGSVVCFYTFTKNKKIVSSKKQAFFFLTFLATSCIFLEQFQFTLQSLEVAFTFFLFEIGMLYLEKYIFEKKVKYSIITILIVTFSIGCYQSFAPMYLAQGIIYLFLYSTEKRENKELLFMFVKEIFFLIVALILYVLISKITLNYFHLEKGSYLTNQIGWFTNPWSINIKNIIKDGIRFYFGFFFKYPSFSLIHTVIFVYIIKECFIRLKEKDYQHIILLLSIFVSPLILTIILGNIEPIRSDLALGIVISFGASYFLKEKKIYIFTICLLISLGTMLYYQYSDLKRYQNDKQMAYEIYDQVKNEVSDKPLLFIGVQDSDKEGKILKSEVIGRSFFDYWGHNDRIVTFMNSLGLEVTTDTNYIEEGTNLMKDKPSYPHKDSILITEKYVVVKLS